MSNLCRLALSFIILFSANSFSASVMIPLQKIATYNFSMDYDCANTDPNPDNCGWTSTEDHTNENLMFYMNAQWNSSIYDELTISLAGENSTTTRHFMDGFYEDNGMNGYFENASATLSGNTILTFNASETDDWGYEVYYDSWTFDGTYLVHRYESQSYAPDSENTYQVTYQAVPLPAAAWFFASALMSLGLTRKK